jgi:hypothetical protein
MRIRKPSQHVFSKRRQTHSDEAAVLLRPTPNDEPGGLRPVHKLHGGVVADLETFGRRRHRDPVRGLLHPFDYEEQLVLVRFDAGLTRRFLAESQETTDQVAKLMQLFVVDFGGCEIWHGSMIFEPRYEIVPAIQEAV